jgi:hypothetical protein
MLRPRLTCFASAQAKRRKLCMLIADAEAKTKAAA